MYQAHLEELGLLKVLERIDNGQQERIDLSVRYALIQRGLIEAGRPLRLSEQGRQLLGQLRFHSGDPGEQHRPEL